MKDDIIFLVNRRLSQAAETLQAAQELVGATHYRDAVNRGYYAMFYASLALLASRMIGSSKHSGVLSLFGEHFVKTGLFSQQAGRHLRSAFDLRQKSDYREDYDPSCEQAQEVIAHAGDFLREAQRVWQQMLSTQANAQQADNQ